MVLSHTLPELGERDDKKRFSLSDTTLSRDLLTLAGIRTPAKKCVFAGLVENKGNPKKAKNANRGTNSGEVTRCQELRRVQDDMIPYCRWTNSISHHLRALRNPPNKNAYTNPGDSPMVSFRATHGILSIPYPLKLQALGKFSSFTDI